MAHAEPLSTTLDQIPGLAEELTAAQDKQSEAVARVFVLRGAPVPPFDHLHDFWFNFTHGPRVDGVPVLEDLPVLPTRLLDFDLNFPFGVPACALTPHAGFIEYFAQRGFDLLTYKTVRDRPWSPHPFPQWAFAPQVLSPLALTQVDGHKAKEPIHASLDPREVEDFSRASLVNSFGVPSLPVDQWKADVASARSLLSSGQVLAVSVMGSPDAPETQNDTDLVRQFVTTAAHAAEAGADIIELNLSCPNTGGELLCFDAALSERVVEAVGRELRNSGKPLFIKISYLESVALRDLVARCQSHIHGIVAINTVPARTVSTEEKSFFPSYRTATGRTVHRPEAGLSGVGIRDLGRKVIRELAEMRSLDQADTDWVIVGVGGVMSPADFKSYRDEGADVVQSCSGAWLNPALAKAVRHEFGSSLGENESIRVGEPPRIASLAARVGELIATGGFNNRSRLR